MAVALRSESAAFDPLIVLVLGPHDTVLRLGAALPGKPAHAGTVYAVVHRGDGLWTHVYRICRNVDGRPRVDFLAFFDGERPEHAAAWAAERGLVAPERVLEPA